MQRSINWLANTRWIGCPKSPLSIDIFDFCPLQKMDLNRDGVVTLEEFIECCRNDETISRSMSVFDPNFWQDAKVSDESPRKLNMKNNGRPIPTIGKKNSKMPSATKTYQHQHHQYQNIQHTSSSVYQFSQNVQYNQAINPFYPQQVSIKLYLAMICHNSFASLINIHSSNENWTNYLSTYILKHLKF